MARQLLAESGRVRICLQGDGSVRFESNGGVPNPILLGMYNDKPDVHLRGSPATGVQAGLMVPVRAHKAVLKHASDHLSKLFSADGYADSHLREYVFESVQHESLRLIVDFIYTNSVCVSAAEAITSVRVMLVAAGYLGMPPLFAACDEFLAHKSRLDMQQCMEAWRFASKYGCVLLLLAAEEAVADNFAAVMSQQEFLNMPFGECEQLMLSEAIVSSSAELRYRAVATWLNHDSELRAVHADNILSFIPFDSEAISLPALMEACTLPAVQYGGKGNIISALLKALKKLDLERPPLPDDLAVQHNRRPGPPPSWLTLNEEQSRAEYPDIMLTHAASDAMYRKIIVYIGRSLSFGVHDIGFESGVGTEQCRLMLHAIGINALLGREELTVQYWQQVADWLVVHGARLDADVQTEVAVNLKYGLLRNPRVENLYYHFWHHIGGRNDAEQSLWLTRPYVRVLEEQGWPGRKFYMPDLRVRRMTNELSRMDSREFFMTRGKALAEWIGTFRVDWPTSAMSHNVELAQQYAATVKKFLANYAEWQRLIAENGVAAFERPNGGEDKNFFPPPADIAACFPAFNAV